MKARDVMTSSVITVEPRTPVSTAARLLAERRVSALPVVEDGKLVGIVSEGDLMHRYEIGTDCAFSGDPWWLRLFGTEGSPQDYVRSHARFVADVMTPDVVTVGPEASLAEVASLLEKRRYSNVTVKGGVVTFRGMVNVESERTAARVAAQTVPGVRGVLDCRLAYRDFPSLL